MYYGKLPILLLAELVEQPSDTMNARIANYILKNLKELHDFSIKELAAKCFVSVASVTRFCHEIGLEGFFELKYLIENTELKYEVYSNAASPLVQKKEYINAVIDGITLVRESLDMSTVMWLVDDIDHYEKVSAFGPLKAATAAINLQTSLLMLGKLINTRLAYSKQIDYLEQADEKDLIIIFSYSGVYFDYKYTQNRINSNIKKPKIYFITGNPLVKPNEYIDRVIYFKSKLDQASHPYQLQITADIIAQAYASRKESNKI